MAKKSAAARQTSASRRPPVTKAQRVTLVRAPGAESTPIAGGNNSTTTARTATVSRPTSSATRTQPTQRPTSPARPTSPTNPPRTTAAPSPTGHGQAVRQAQRSGRIPQRARTANMVTAEHYSYVRRDLVIIAVLAAVLFLVIVGLYIYFHAIGQA